MKKAPFICVLTLSLVTTSLFTGSSACQGVPSMAVAAACHKVSTGQAMYELCMKTLHADPPESEVTAYALDAANAASESYSATMEAARRLQQNASLPGELRAAYTNCDQKDRTALRHIGAVVGGLGWCWLTDLKREYMGAVAAVDDCANKLRQASPSSPLYGMVLADRDRTMLASLLGGLVVKRLAN